MLLASVVMMAQSSADSTSIVPAEFPGGIDALESYLQNNIKYPRLAKDHNVTGEVVVSFVIEEDGSVTTVKCLSDIGDGCGEEAVRVIAAMPRWTPSYKGGKAVKSQFAIPVTFDFQLKKPGVKHYLRSLFSKSDE